ncbi:hypothetical protein ACFSYD_26500 [Paracoccus aerius]
MLRSFDYAAMTVAARQRDSFGGAERGQDRIEHWRQSAMRDFLDAYRSHSKGVASLPEDEAAWQVLLDFFLLHKAIYEAGYELSNRPNWIGIPSRASSNCWDKATHDNSLGKRHRGHPSR